LQINRLNLKVFLFLIALFALVLLLLITIPNLPLNVSFESLAHFNHFIDAKPVFSFFVFLLFYTAICSVPFPLISIFTLGAGYFFGFTYGLLLTSFGSAIGGLILFLFARRFISTKLITQLVKRFPKVKPILQSDDIYIATGIRFIPGLPFFLPSLVFSITSISAIKFYISTQLGLLVTMAVYINAGAALSELDNNINNLFSFKLVASMVFIAVLPMLYKAFEIVRNKKLNPAN